MKQEFIIMDASVKYMDAKNPLEEGLLYSGTNRWNRKLEQAFKYTTTQQAIEQARELQKEAPVRVYMLQINGPQIGFAEVKF
jgi:hypothetical protein